MKRKQKKSKSRRRRQPSSSAGPDQGKTTEKEEVEEGERGASPGLTDKKAEEPSTQFVAPEPPPSQPSPPSLPKDQSEVELELKFLQALEFYHPARLLGIHRHFVLYGMIEFLEKSSDRQFKAEDVLQLLDRFYNLEAMKPDDEDVEALKKEVEFSLPESIFSYRFRNRKRSRKRNRNRK